MKAILFFASIVFLTTYICWDVITGIVSDWGRDEYSYAYLIIPISLLLCLHRLADKRPTPGDSWAGVIVTFAGLVFHAIGEFSAIPTMPQYSLLIILLGLVLALLGKPAFLTLFPALIYLFFAIPLPQVLYMSLSAKLQLMSSTFGTDALQFIGIPVFQEGNIIDLGTYKLQVEEACNGLRYLFPLLGYSFLVAYLFQGSLWKRVLLFLSAAPIALCINVFRIALVGITVDWWGGKMAEGFLHEFEGMIAFCFCIGLLFVEGVVLSRIGNRGTFDFSVLSVPHGPYFSKPVAIRGVALFMLSLLLVAAAGKGMGFVAIRPEIIPAHLSFEQFPLELGTWRGRSQSIPTQALVDLHASDYLNIDYVNKNDQRLVNLFVVYYATQREGKTFHSPDICVPGSGWEIISEDEVDLTHIITDRPLRVNRYIIQKGSVRQVLYYWFEQRGINLTTLFSVKLHIIEDSLLRSRTDGSLVRVVTPIDANESQHDAEVRLQGFLRLALNPMRGFLPDLSIYQKQ